MNEQNDIILRTNTADSLSFSSALQRLTGSLMSSARENILAATEGLNYTDIELRSMITIEGLRLTNGMELATILTRYGIIQQIEMEGLVSVHPNQYTDLTHMAREQGISTSDLSDTKALGQHIFPYVTDVLGLSLADLWTTVGKSAFREMVPALRALITGEQPAHQSVRTAVAQMLDQAAAQLLADGQMPDGEVAQIAAVRAQAVTSLLNDGATLPSAQLRRRIRPSRTAPVDMVTLDIEEESWLAVIRISSRDQLDMVTRALRDHANNMNLNGRGEDVQSNVRAMRRLFGDIS